MVGQTTSRPATSAVTPGEREGAGADHPGLRAEGGVHDQQAVPARRERPVGHHPCKDSEMTTLHQFAASGGTDTNGAEGVLTLPEGYATKVPAGKQLVIQSHYINTGAARDVDDQISLKRLNPADVVAYAQPFVVFNDNWTIPANSPLCSRTRPATAAASLNGAISMSSRTLLGIPAESGTGAGKLPERLGARLISE